MKMTQEAIKERAKFFATLSPKAKEKLLRDGEKNLKFQSFVNACFQWVVDNQK